MSLTPVLYILDILTTYFSCHSSLFIICIFSQSSTKHVGYDLREELVTYSNNLILFSIAPFQIHRKFFLLLLVFSRVKRAIGEWP